MRELANWLGSRSLSKYSRVQIPIHQTRSEAPITMRTRYKKFNSKRRFLQINAAHLKRLRTLSELVRYGGNPEHKKHPGDFKLTPPSDPRPGKSLCDVAGIYSRHIARALLQDGLRKGLVSDRQLDGWPKNIWAVSEKSCPLEAQLENASIGGYHAYPMPPSDPLAREVLIRWGWHLG